MGSAIKKGSAVYEKGSPVFWLDYIFGSVGVGMPYISCGCAYSFFGCGWVGISRTDIRKVGRLELLADAPPHPAAVLVRVG